MPSADVSAIKQNEKNNLLDLRLTGISIELHTRPSPSNSRPSSRIDYPRRAMSVIPTLFFQDKGRKTVVPWRRPQSADTASDRGAFAKKHSHLKGLAPGYRSASCLVEKSLASSPSPDPAKLEPGLISKPPIPPPMLKHKHKSLDDIINMKFQRWFPESVAESGDQYINMNCSEENDEEGRGVTLESAQSDYLDLDRCGSEGSSRGGLTSPDIAIDSEENRRPIKDSKRFSQQDPFMQSARDREISLECYPSSPPNNKFICGNTGHAMLNERSLSIDHPPRSYSEMDTDRKNHTGIRSPNENTPETSYPLPRDDQDSPGGNYSTGDSLCNSPLKTFSPSPIEKNKLPQEVVYPPPTSTEPHCETPSDNFPLENETIKKLKKVTISNENLLPLKKMSDHSPTGRKYFCGANKINSTEDCNRQSLTLAKLTESVTPSSKTAEILSWMGSTENNHQIIPDTVAVNSTYDDLLNMIKVIEQEEEVESIKLEALSTSRSTNNSACSNVAARDILTFLDEVDKNETKRERPVTTVSDVPKPKSTNQINEIKGGKLAQLLTMDRTELAQRCMFLSLQLEESNSAIQRSKGRLKELEANVEKQKAESDEIVQRHQKFIDQLIREKKVLGEQCADLVKDMQSKHSKALKAMDERHALNLKNLEQKLLVAEKVRREKWVDAKTRKIKELTVKGLEPELNRMAESHQEQISELRRCHEKELADLETSWRRRLNTSREQALRDREQAVQQEREAARTKIEHEMSDMERSYQEQRKRLMTEVREEKERLEREVESQVKEKNRQLEEKWNQAAAKLDEKLADLQAMHQAELKTLRETLEGERESWLVHQTAALSSKEKTIREECKKERDRHIEAVLRKFDSEALEKEILMQQKLQKMKENYETEVKEMEETIADLKRKIKEARTENQALEENNTKLNSDLTVVQRELTINKQLVETLKLSEHDARKNAHLQANAEISRLQKELAEERASKDELLSSVQLDKDRQLNQVFHRVKEAVSKKDDQIKLLQKERDAALEQFSQLENLLEQQRKSVQIN